LKAFTSSNATGEPDARSKRIVKFQPVSRPCKSQRSSLELKPEVQKHCLQRDRSEYDAAKATTEAALSKALNEEEQGLVEWSSTEEFILTMKRIRRRHSPMSESESEKKSYPNLRRNQDPNPSDC